MDERLSSVRLQLEWACDALIPRDENLGMPSATEAGMLDTLLPRALRARPDLQGAFLDAVSTLPPDQPADPLAAVKALDPDAFGVVSHLVAGAYFLNEDVTRKLGYHGQEAMTDEPDYDEIDAAVQRVRARGTVYIPTPR